MASAGITGLLLAGGLGRRMGGGDKCLRPLGGRTILHHVVERAAPQVETLALSANGDPDRFAGYGLPVLADPIPDFAGPLAGILAGLEWAATRQPCSPWLLSVATDTPFFPPDLAERLLAAVTAEGADLALAASAGKPHPVFGLWPARLAADLRRALIEEGMRKVSQWAARYRLARVEFPVGAIDPFFNVNRPEDLDRAEWHLAAAL